MPGLLDKQHVEPTNLQNVQLHSNDKPIAMGNVRFIKKWPRETPIEILRDVLAKDGYLYVQGVIPRDVVLECRQK
jgi:predicted phage gp36 major capsid-like protein